MGTNKNNRQNIPIHKDINNFSDDYCQEGDEPDKPESVASLEKKLQEAIRMAQKESLSRLNKGFLDSVGNDEMSATDAEPCDEEEQDSNVLDEWFNTGERTVLPEKCPRFLDNSLIDPEFFQGVSLIPVQLTESMNAMLAGKIFCNHLAHCRPLGGFLVFTGKRWEKDEDKARGLIMSFASQQLHFAGEQLIEQKVN
ncbi:MAG: hypothetical protein LBT59_13090, partial [Clostridiales bacterium]|nr:hypothetical protein [Clostridiales bacterium]